MFRVLLVLLVCALAALGQPSSVGEPVAQVDDCCPAADDTDCCDFDQGRCCSGFAWAVNPRTMPHVTHQTSAPEQPSLLPAHLLLPRAAGPPPLPPPIC